MGTYKQTITLLDAAEATGAGNAFGLKGQKATFQATLDAVSTTPAATVDIEVSNDGVAWIVMGTISVSGVSDSDGFASDAPWKLARANVTAISDGGGTAQVTVTLGL